MRAQQDRRWRQKLQNKFILQENLMTQRTDVIDPSVPAVWGTCRHSRCEYLWIYLMSVWDDAAPKFCHSTYNKHTHTYVPSKSRCPWDSLILLTVDIILLQEGIFCARAYTHWNIEPFDWSWAFVPFSTITVVKDMENKISLTERQRMMNAQ